MLDVLDMLGAEEADPSVKVILWPKGDPDAMLVSVEGPRHLVRDPALVRRVKRVTGIRALSIGAGAVLGAVAGALGVRSSRLAGGLLGGLVAGPLLGSCVGQLAISGEAESLPRDLTAAWKEAGGGT